MELLYAISGWQWAVAGFVPAGILALYFLKLKRKPLQVPSTFLWKRSIEDLHVNSFWQRLRKNILLLLQLLVAAMVIGALLRPTIAATDVARFVILMIDNSASMSATDAEPTRLEAAKQKAREIVEQLQPGDSAMVIAFHDSARVACSYTQNHGAVKHAISTIEPSNRRTDLHEALTIASGLANPHQSVEGGAEAVPATMYLFSDGNFPKISDIALGNLTPRFFSIGKSARNVGVLALSARHSESRPDQLEIFASVHNFGEEPAEVTAELLVDNTRADLQRVTIPNGETQPILFRLMSREELSLSVKIDVDDDFAGDNQAWTVVNSPQKARVLVVGDDNVVLKTVLGTDESLQLADVKFEPKSFAERDLSDESKLGDYDLIVFDRCAPLAMPPCNTLFIGSVPPALAAVEQTKVNAPIILNWSSHPVLRFLQLGDVNVMSAFTLPLPKGADQLIESDKGALLFAMPRGVFTDVVQTFALVDEQGRWHTDWPLKLSFPLYMLNVLSTLGGGMDQAGATLSVGDPISFRATAAVEQATIESPSGKHATVKRSKLGKFEFLDTEERGIYKATMGDSSRTFAINLFDELESSIKSQKEILVGTEQVADATTEFVARRELWKPLTLIALALLLLEWYIYNRRVYI